MKKGEEMRMVGGWREGKEGGDTASQPLIRISPNELEATYSPVMGGLSDGHPIH